MMHVRVKALAIRFHPAQRVANRLGSHRLAACELLGLAEVECIVMNEDDLHAELSMIDENLCRNELSPAERASQTARRKAIYEELHPETRASVAGADARWNATDNLSTASFAAETAKVSSKDERTVRRDAERGEKVIPEVIDMITGTKLDTGTYLDKLKRLPPNEQVAAAKRDLALLRSQKTARPASRYGLRYFWGFWGCPSSAFSYFFLRTQAPFGFDRLKPSPARTQLLPRWQPLRCTRQPGRSGREAATIHHA